MAKKSTIAGEYIIEIADNGHVDLYRIFSNAKAAMRDIARSRNFEVSDKWNTQDLGRHLVKEFGDGTTADFDDVKVTRLADGKIEIFQQHKNVKQGLRDIVQGLSAGGLDFSYEEGWNTQTFGSKLADYLADHKEEADTILKTPRGGRK